jgi:hypothetical protein
MAQQLIGLARPRRPHRVGAGGIGADIGAALFLGHGHAQRDPGFLADVDVARVVFSGPSTLGSQTAATSGCRRSAGTLAKVMVSGQPLPASAWLCR